MISDSMQGFKRTIPWYKFRSEITTEPKNNNLDYLISLIQHLEIFIGCLFFHSKIATMILQEIILINITCHSRNQRF